MAEAYKNKFFSAEAKILFWPSFVDMLITTLMIILLVYFLQTVLNIGDLEALRIRQEQDRFVSSFRERFSKEEEQGKITIYRTPTLIRITFADGILFTSGKYELEKEGKQVLLRVAKFFMDSKSYDFKQIQVEGHTDNERISNPNNYPHNNWELSTGRAISVVKFLVEDNQLSESLNKKVIISANGYAEFKPVADNDNEPGRKKNRRIEILIFFSTPEDHKK